jgi:hypothetical protein
MLNRTVTLLSSENIAKKILTMKELFIQSFFPDSHYYKWINKKDNLPEAQKLTSEEREFLQSFSNSLIEILFPKGFPDEECIGLLNNQLQEVQKYLENHKPEDDENQYEAKKEEFKRLVQTIKDETWKSQNYDDYKIALLGTEKSTGEDGEHAFIRVPGIPEDNINGLKRLLDINPELKKIFTMDNLSQLLGIAKKFKHYMKEIVGNNDEIQHPRRHPLFPTLDEPQEIKNRAFSDHLPILLKPSIGTNNETVNILTFNILGPNGSSGLQSTEKQTRDGSQRKEWESKEQSIERYKKIVNGVILNSIKKHNVNIIMLQEVRTDKEEYILDYLNKTLGDNWDIKVGWSGIVTCYNKVKYHEVGEIDEETGKIKFDKNKSDRTGSITLQSCDTSTIFTAINIWGRYSPFPNDFEQTFKKLINKDHDVIICGDTNSRLAPPIHPDADHQNNKIRNLTTGLIPTSENEKNGADSKTQITDSPDGGFIKNSNDQIQQLNNYPLDFITAEIVEDHREYSSELNAWSEYRMVICLDDLYQEYKLPTNETLFEYEENIKSLLGDRNLLVRMAADQYNHKAIGIRFSPDSIYYTKLTERFKEPEFSNIGILNKFLQDSRENNYGVIFIPLEKFHILNNAIIATCHIERIDKEISKIANTDYSPNEQLRIDSIETLTNLKEFVWINRDQDVTKVVRAWKTIYPNKFKTLQAHPPNAGFLQSVFQSTSAVNLINSYKLETQHLWGIMLALELLGATLGAIIGGAIGIMLAPFTLGLSIPIGILLGAFLAGVIVYQALSVDIAKSERFPPVKEVEENKQQAGNSQTQMGRVLGIQLTDKIEERHHSENKQTNNGGESNAQSNNPEVQASRTEPPSQSSSQQFRTGMQYK